MLKFILSLLLTSPGKPARNTIIEAVDIGLGQLQNQFGISPQENKTIILVGLLTVGVVSFLLLLGV